MSGAALTPQRAYDVHGIGVAIRSQEPAVIEAMELRLRDFHCDAVSRPEVRFEFVVNGRGGDRALPPLGGASRPVYDTPFGSLDYFPDADALDGELAGVRLRCDASRGVALLHSAAFAGRDLYLATHPLATIALMELLERRGLFSLHAACLSTGDGRGVLLSGPSGAGKSTLALALARAGMSFLSDDLVFLEPDRDGDGVRVRGFADAVGLTPHAAERFEELRAALEMPPADGFPKRLRRIEDLFGAPSVPVCVPYALVFPEVVRERPSAIAPLDPREALVRLVPDVLLTEPAATRAHLGALAALLGQVRCYALKSGSDLERAAALVRDLV
ncbi:MAG TPA: hypothetical protein VFF79_06505 [Conexibacter sp.]|nr:hypothetical protein [Conexibacter sp.]